MGILSKIFGSATAEPIKAIGNIIDTVVDTDEEKANAKALLLKIEQHPALVQAEINKVQAQSRHWFVAAARPAFMWICAAGFAFAFLINPIIAWVWPDRIGPELPMEYLMNLTIALLGFAGYRTVEKIKGVAK